MAEDIFGGVRDAMGLMQTMALMNVYNQRDDDRNASLRLRENELQRKLAEDQVQTSLYMMQTRKAGEEALQLEQKRERRSFYDVLNVKRYRHMLDPDAPALEPEEYAAFNAIGREFNLISKDFDPDPLTDAKIANLHAQTQRLDTYLQQTRGWVPRIEQEVGFTTELYGKEAAYSEMKAQARIPEMAELLAKAKEKKAPAARIAELQRQHDQALSQLNQEFGVEQLAKDAFTDRLTAVQAYRQRADQAVNRIEALVGNPKLKAADLEQQRVLIEQERDMYRALERKAVLEVDYLKALGDDNARSPIRKQLDAANAGLQQMAGAFRESVKASEEQRSALQLEKLNVQRDRLKLSETQYEQSQEYQKNLIAAQAAFLEGDQSQKALAAASRKYGVRADQILGATKNPNASLVNITMDREISKGFAEQYLKVQEAGAAAVGKIAKLDRMEALLEGVETGKLTPLITDVQAIADSFGIQVDPKLGAKQALDSLSNEMALELRNPSGGAGMPGALSDQDRKFLASMTPGLSKTREGNKLIIDTRRKLAEREQEVAQMARAYRKKHGSLDEGFYDELADNSQKHPLFKGKTIPGGGEAAKPGWSIKPIQ